jgi:hypothetical protein
MKKALVSTLAIQPSDWTLPFEVMMCDASDYSLRPWILVVGRNASIPKAIGKRLHRPYGPMSTDTYHQTFYTKQLGVWVCETVRGEKRGRQSVLYA